jgi:hypothetical protein
MGQPPPPPSAAPPGDGSGPVAIAITKLRIGIATPQGTPSNDAWKQYGVNLDGALTTFDYTGHCKPNSNASPKDVFPDGLDGRDNSWGKKLLPIFKSLTGSTDLEGSVNQGIADGTWTFLVDLPDLGTGAAYDPLSAYGLTGKEGAGSSWKFAPEDLSGSTPDTTIMQFGHVYLTNDTLVATDGDVRISLGFLGDLKLHPAVVAMKLSADHANATDGVIAGVVNTEEFIADFKKIAGEFSPNLCEGQAIDGVVNQMRQASDILADGTQDPNKTCNGISVGFGFDGAAVSLAGLAAPATPQPDPCQTF